MNLRCHGTCGGKLVVLLSSLRRSRVFLYRENFSEITLGRNLDADGYRRPPGAAPHRNYGWFG